MARILVWYRYNSMGRSCCSFSNCKNIQHQYSAYHHGKSTSTRAAKYWQWNSNLALVGQFHYAALAEKDPELVADITEHAIIEQELAGFDASIKTRGLPMDTSLQKDDIIYSVAPSEHHTPVSLLEDEHFEEYAFPNSFPQGVGGFTSVKQHNKTITPRKYFNQRVLNTDRIFETNIEYLLAAQYATESKDVNDQVHIAMRKTQNPSVNPLTAGFVRDKETLNSMIMKDTAYKFLSHISKRNPIILAENFL